MAARKPWSPELRQKMKEALAKTNEESRHCFDCGWDRPMEMFWDPSNSRFTWTCRACVKKYERQKYARRSGTRKGGVEQRLHKPHR